ncbi:MAG: hypothetical protein WC423_08035 [Vulcanimicrobiota bacterium]
MKKDQGLREKFSRNKIEELLEGLAVEGVRKGTGAFTVAPDEVWKGLGHAVPDGGGLPRFCLRWLVAHHPRRVEVQQNGRRIAFTAHRTGPPPASQPRLDYAGKDIDLARALVSARKLKASDLLVTLQGREFGWSGAYPAEGAAQWARQEGAPDPFIRLEFQLPNKRSAAGWKSLLAQRFQHAPIPILWQGEELTRLFEFSEHPLIWRRLLPHSPDRPKLDIRAPAKTLADFVCSRRWDNEVLMSLSTHRESRIQLVYHGELFEVDKPGFLPGFEILANYPELTLDIQGMNIVKSKKLDAFFETLRGEAYDMVLQLYHANPPPDRQTLALYLVAVQAVLVYLLSEKRFVEGAALASWLNDSLGGEMASREPTEAYTLYRTAALHCEQANRHGLYQIFDTRAKKVVKNNPGQFVVEAALVDAYLESRSRRGESELLSHPTRSSLHLLGVRCREQGVLEQTFRLHYVLLTSAALLRQEHLDLWFEVAGLARDLGKLDHLKRLLRFLKQSRKHGTVMLGPAIKARANQFADFVSKR